MMEMIAEVFGKVGMTTIGRSRSCGLPNVDISFVGSISKEEVVTESLSHAAELEVTYP